MINNKEPTREYFGSKASVWWDMDKCPIPDGYDAWRVGPCIKSELKKLGYSGPLEIFGLGNLNHIPDHVLQALSSTGIVLKHLPTEISHATILSFMLFWKHEIKDAPFTLMIISDSVGFDLFYRVLSRLQKDYKCNILLAYKDPLKGDYSLFTHEQWFWKSLLRDAKCSVTGDFSCFLCEFDCQNFEEFTTHLKGEDHAHEELLLKPGDLPGVESSLPKRKQPKRKVKKMKMTYEHLPKQDHEEVCH